MEGTFGFLLFNDFEDLDFVGPWEMIGVWSQKFSGPKIITVSESTQFVKSSLGLSLQSDVAFADCPQLDYLLIPGGWGTRSEVDNQNLIAFIQQQSRATKAILSVCTGAFLLQKAGLLSGKKATTHWGSMERLRQFSDVMVVEERYVRDGNIWTSAGVSAGIDLSLAFIAEVASPEVAGQVQLYAEYYPAHKIYPAAQDQILPKYV